MSLFCYTESFLSPEASKLWRIPGGLLRGVLKESWRSCEESWISAEEAWGVLKKLEESWRSPGRFLMSPTDFHVQQLIFADRRLSMLPFQSVISACAKPPSCQTPLPQGSYQTATWLFCQPAKWYHVMLVMSLMLLPLFSPWSSTRKTRLNIHDHWQQRSCHRNVNCSLTLWLQHWRSSHFSWWPLRCSEGHSLSMNVLQSLETWLHPGTGQWRCFCCTEGSKHLRGDLEIQERICREEGQNLNLSSCGLKPNKTGGFTCWSWRKILKTDVNVIF